MGGSRLPLAAGCLDGFCCLCYNAAAKAAFNVISDSPSAFAADLVTETAGSVKVGGRLRNSVVHHTPYETG